MKAHTASSSLFLLSTLTGTFGLTQVQRKLINSTASSLEWAPCGDLEMLDYEKLYLNISECAKLPVPLDYNDECGTNIDLSLIRIRSSVQPSKGSVLINPGGPGLSGMSFITSGGKTYQDVLGGEYDLVSWDTRGTGRTVPFSCKKSQSSKRRRDVDTRYQHDTLPQRDFWGEIKGEMWDDFGVLSDACNSSMAEYGRHIGTATTVRDMLSIVDSLKEGGKLKYWGLSYGAVLGQYFAAMFPDRFDRMLLDSVPPINGYLDGTWLTQFRDIQTLIKVVFDYCIKIGDACVLANHNGKGNTTPDSLMEATKQLFEDAANVTVPADANIPDTGDFQLGQISVARRMKELLSGYLYNPLTMGKVPELLNAGFKGDWKRIMEQQQGASGWNLGAHAMFGIACGDSPYRAESVDDLYPMVQAYLAQGSFGDTSSIPRLVCTRWPFEAAEMMDPNKLLNVKTSSPVLFTNTRYDPATPLSGAYTAATRFRGSGFLLHNGVGHGVVHHPSKCVNEAIKEYFDSGTLPATGTVCEPGVN